MQPIALILNSSKTAIHALRAIVGALETDACTRDEVEVVFAKGRETLITSIKEAMRRCDKVVVGWSFYSPQFSAILKELEWVKERVDDARVIHLAGGVHATAEPEQTLKAGFDFIAVGEGERIIIDFIDRVRKSKDLRTTRGIAYLADGALVRNGRGEFVDLNDFPPFAIKHRRFGPIEITRGCIYACKFCQTPFMNKARFRHRTVDNICHYVRIMRDHGLRDYRFITPTSLSYGSADEKVRLDKIEALLASVRATIGKNRRLYYGTFPSEVRPEHVTPQALTLLKKYVDNDNLIIGGQSGSQRVLDTSCRGHSVQSIVEAVKLATAAGFTPNVDFLFGLPGETPRDVKASLKLAQELVDLGARVHGHTFMPLPGTPFRNEAPGTIEGDVVSQLDILVSQRRMYGQWKTHRKLAKELVARRDHLM